MHFNAMRPTFQMRLPYARDEVLRRVTEELRQPDRTNPCLVFKQYVELHVPEHQVRCWSPHLSLSFEGDEQETQVLGRFAPRMEVWTLIWVLYLALTFSAFFAAIIECAHWMMGQSSWCGPVCLLALLGLGGIYLLSQLGQALSTDQMHALKSDLESVVGRAFPACQH